jgi:hypothetical protein
MKLIWTSERNEKTLADHERMVDGIERKTDAAAHCGEFTAQNQAEGDTEIDKGEPERQSTRK